MRRALKSRCDACVNPKKNGLFHFSGKYKLQHVLLVRTKAFRVLEWLFVSLITITFILQLFAYIRKLQTKMLTSAVDLFFFRWLSFFFRWLSGFISRSGFCSLVLRRGTLELVQERELSVSCFTSHWLHCQLLRLGQHK